MLYQSIHSIEEDITMMKQHGYFLVKMAKTLNLYLWAKTVEELTEGMTEKELKKYEIVPSFKDGSKDYIEYKGKMLRIA